MINKFDWDSKPELNITPLVDVMLVLLAVLMVTTPTIIYEEKIILPSGSKTKVLEKIQIVEISIDKNKIIAIHHRKGSFSEGWINYCGQNKITYKLVDCFSNDIIDQL